MKLQYRDRWPTPEEARAHQSGTPYAYWMYRSWCDQPYHDPPGWSVPEMVTIHGYPDDGELVIEACDWRTVNPGPDWKASVAPIDRDGNAVEWPT